MAAATESSVANLQVSLANCVRALAGRPRSRVLGASDRRNAPANGIASDGLGDLLRRLQPEDPAGMRHSNNRPSVAPRRSRTSESVRPQSGRRADHLHSYSQDTLDAVPSIFRAVDAADDQHVDRGRRQDFSTQEAGASRSREEPLCGERPAAEADGHVPVDIQVRDPGVLGPKRDLARPALYA